jgi:hypothetical protein
MHINLSIWQLLGVGALFAVDKASKFNTDIITRTVFMIGIKNIYAIGDC